MYCKRNCVYDFRFSKINKNKSLKRFYEKYKKKTGAKPNITFFEPAKHSMYAHICIGLSFCFQSCVVNNN